MRPAPDLTYIIRRRREQRLVQANRRRRRLVTAITIAIIVSIVGVLLLGVTGVAAAVGIYMTYARDLPPPSQIADIREEFQTTRIYDRTGQRVIYEVVDPDGDRQYVPISEIPKTLIEATLAIEDKTFYTNPGFDIRGIIRAVWLAIQSDTVQGGSTITQQLVKQTLIDPKERTAVTTDRKIKEVILAAEISRLYSKDQILEWYFNTNFYGNLAYGVDAAAKVYFGKRVQDLTLGEAAILAAIPQNPALNPIDNPQPSRERQRVVLEYMLAQGYITQEQMTQTLQETVIISPLTERFGITAPHFSIFARQQAEQLLNEQGLDGARLVLGGGLKIYTTLDLDLQYQVECAARAYIIRISGGGATAAPNTTNGTPCTAAQYLPALSNFDLTKPRPVTNASVVVIRPDTGEILSLIGSVDYWNTGIQGNFNAALGLRQPASTFKPFVYVTAFASSQPVYTPATMVLDIPTTFNQNGIPYTPRNEDEQFHGPMSVRKALANSYNIPVVRVMADLGITNVVRRARQLGLSSLNPTQESSGLALALGSSEVTLLDLTYAYTVFANLGTMVGKPDANPRPGFRTLDPTSVLRIEDKDGNVLWEYKERTPTLQRANVLRDALAYLINDILADNQSRQAAFGVDNALALTRPAAVKTGTTNDNRDAWTVGYTPDIVTGVWVGNNNNASMGDDVSGSTGAAPIWHAIMEYYLQGKPVSTWQRPASVVEATVCQISGLLPTPDCDKTKELFFQDSLSSTVPTQPDIYWKRVQINRRNGKLATSSTPSDAITESRFFEPPQEALAWARSVGWPLPPTDYDLVGTAENQSGRISSPAGLGLVHGTVEVRGVLDEERVVSYNLEYGAGINPTAWVNIGGGNPSERGEDVLLGTWNTRDLDGLYTLRLGLTLSDGRFEPSILQVTVDNVAPTVHFTAPEQNDSFRVSDSVVKLTTDVSDNLAVAKVEFYHNGELITTIENAPFSADWVIDKAGVHTFMAVAYDTAGNIGQSETLTVNIRE
ncbi:MAG: transglycosylase domain-containing protein [Anaerolineae bacterium]|nr:transglycosylase domain-containing protein [Anaerolineae bacterium]